MSKENTKARNKLIEKYGEVCFIEELKLRKPEEIEEERQRKYTGKKQLAICDQLTYHHIVEKCKRRESNRREWSFASLYQSSMVQ